MPAPTPTWERLLRFGVVGGLSAALDVGLLVGLRDGLGVATAVATTVAFFVALVVNFALHRRWSFGGADRTRSLRGSAWRYGVLVVVNWLATLVLVLGAEALGLPYLLGKVVAMGLAGLGTFVAYDRWVFV